MKAVIAALAGIVAAAPVAAQQAQQQHMQHGGDHMVANVRPLYETVRGYLVRAAEQMPEANYSFKPTPEVRSFGQLIGHVANANYMFCNTALGGENPNKTDFEKTTQKAALVAGLKESFTYCDRAYQITDMQAMENVQVFGTQRTKMFVLNLNYGHDFEHYGNVVTYMRLKGLVPPSSAGGN
jgi:uncharacterized damage-inducible protein DinB